MLVGTELNSSDRKTATPRVPPICRKKVTEEVVETAHDALFASLLEVHDGSREAFEERREGFDGEVEVLGSENVDRVVWHTFDGEAIAATYQNEPEAARGTLRRQAFGRLYRDVF